MSKKMIVNIVTVLILAVLLISVVTPVFAAGTSPDQFTPNYSGDAKGNSIVGKILGFLQWIGAALAVIILIVIGIQYLVGSAEQKAEYKKTMIPYVVGAILIFAAPTIANIVYNAITSNS